MGRRRRRICRQGWDEDRDEDHDEDHDKDHNEEDVVRERWGLVLVEEEEE